MPTTMNLIAKQTVGAGGAASVTFSSIPQTFTDLKVVASTRTNSAQSDNSMDISFNGSSSSFSARFVYGSGSAAASGTGSTLILQSDGGTATANTFGSAEIYIPNYTSTSNAKSYSNDGVTENNATSAIAGLLAGLWSATPAAITSLTLTASGSFVEFSEFSLYGISSNTTTQNQTTPLASGGDVITTDGTYWYHTFLYSGTFTPVKNLTCDYLVVAGGGGGGAEYGGGGGAGGYRTSIGGTPLSLTGSTTYSAVVGSGGAGGISYATNSVSGTNSSFSSITSSGGGRAGSRTAQYDPSTGGSGGGGGGGSTTRSGAAGNAGSYSPVEGFGGGPSNGNAGGGGGGAGVASTNQNGGNGASNSISGSSVTYAGGGGGGCGSGTPGTAGTGGGGAGRGGANSNLPGFNGTVNTGGGGGGGAEWSGGGSQTQVFGGTGGSGIIVVRYAV
jgi:hypothetical protein